MTVGIVDADLIGRKRHRFPNLVCLKLSAYHKERGDDVKLITNYDGFEKYDKVYISKVFTDTPIDEEILKLPNVEYGGTGFFFDKAPNLPDEIEHHMPDYHLYDDFVNEQIERGLPRNEFKEYLDYSIGYLTRGCFRKCDFCVIKKYDRAEVHSPVGEFLDPTRKKICLLDDNFFSHPKWSSLLQELIATRKPFKFKQGLDERLLTDGKIEILCSARYDGSITFAFDNIADWKIIEKNLKRLRKFNNKEHKFYVLTGFDRNSQYDEEFWISDICDTFERIQLLMKYGCLAYVMRFEKYKESPYKGIYITMARWTNQPSMFRNLSINDFANMNGNTSAKRYVDEFTEKHPQVAAKYFDLKYNDLKNSWKNNG